MRILVVEDETKVGCFIKRALEEESYAVDLCENGAQGLDMALSGNYDLIVIDLMLPGLPGLEVLTRLRKEKIHTPVLILTAQSKVDQRVKGLDAGADDYLTKPLPSTNFWLACERSCGGGRRMSPASCRSTI
ncbi:MAG: response regulator [Nitrospiraceae bacterium]